MSLLKKLDNYIVLLIRAVTFVLCCITAIVFVCFPGLGFLFSLMAADSFFESKTGYDMKESFPGLGSILYTLIVVGPQALVLCILFLYLRSQ
jgi:hypothetical protein